MKLDSVSFNYYYYDCGCAGTPVIQVNTPFAEDDYIPYTKDGTGNIKGQAFLKTQAGDVKYGAGNTIYLIPTTSYTKELMDKAIDKGGGFTTNMDYRLNKYIRTTIADGEGRFDFLNCLRRLLCWMSNCLEICHSIWRNANRGQYCKTCSCQRGRVGEGNFNSLIYCVGGHCPPASRFMVGGAHLTLLTWSRTNRLNPNSLLTANC